MTKEEIASCLMTLYEDLDKPLPKTKIALFYEYFGHVSAIAGWAATRWLLSQDTYGSVRISDFSRAVLYVSGSVEDLPEPVAAWRQCVACISEGSFKSLSEPVREAILGITSFYDFRRSSQVQQIRRQFLEEYGSIRELDMQERILPPQLKQELQKIRDRPQPKLRLANGE